MNGREEEEEEEGGGRGASCGSEEKVLRNE